MGRPARLRVVGGVKQSPLHGVSAKGDDYDPAEFYVTSVDKHGHSDNRRMRIDPTVSAEVGRLIASGALGGTPIQSFGDFVRDAVVHNMQRISKMVADDHFAEAAEDARRLARAESVVREQETKAKLIDDCRSAFDGAQQARDRMVIMSLLELYEPMTERLREPYAGQLEDVLKAARRWLVNDR